LMYRGITFSCTKAYQADTESREKSSLNLRVPVPLW
jgi:hypothetical protein